MHTATATAYGQLQKGMEVAASRFPLKVLPATGRVPPQTAPARTAWKPSPRMGSLTYLQMQALCLFKAEDKDHRSFPYLHSYEILKHVPKWIERRRQLAGHQPSKKQKTSVSTFHVLSESPINVDDSDDGTPTQESQHEGKRRKTNFNKMSDLQH